MGRGWTDEELIEEARMDALKDAALRLARADRSHRQWTGEMRRNHGAERTAMFKREGSLLRELIAAREAFDALDVTP